MSLPLRLNFEGKDYSFRVLPKLISKETSEFKISLEGEELTVKRDSDNCWKVLEESINDNHDLLKAVVRAVCLRFRI